MFNPYQVVREFEKTVAEYAGSKYAVAVESGTAALFLSCIYKKVKEVEIPRFTYPSVACSIINAGGKIKFRDEDWKGIYELKPYKIYDGALAFYPGMYKGGLHCLSFHIKKVLPIGRGGMILTDSKKACTWLRKARFDGRDEIPLEEDKLTQTGWNMYMSPDQAVRGLQLMTYLPNDILDWKLQGYTDLSKVKAYK